MSDWKLIKTAPKTRKILLGKYERSSWRMAVARWRYGVWFAGRGIESREKMKIVNATHWHELPKAPKLADRMRCERVEWLKQLATS